MVDIAEVRPGQFFTFKGGKVVYEMLNGLRYRSTQSNRVHDCMSGRKYLDYVTIVRKKK